MGSEVRSGSELTTYDGILTFWSETGTEGGAWAFQDRRFMNLSAPPHFRCTRCGRVWDKGAEPEPPHPLFMYYDEDSRGCRMSDNYLADGDVGPPGFDADFYQSSNDLSRQCLEEGHEGWESMYPNGISSYDGLHILKDGDHLTVWDGDRAIFTGVVQLPPRQDPYAPDAYVAGGGWTAHRRPPVGTEESWWFGELQATLTTTA